MSGWTGPSSLESTEPSAGQPSAGCRRLVRPLWHWKAKWSPSQPTIVRMIASLSIICARRGKCSQISMPGTLVLMA
jgi:hypothetical protein